MCGIQINKTWLDNKVSHRGDFHFKQEIGQWKVHFSSLPLSSHDKGLTQPILLENGDYLVFNGEIFNYKDFGDYKSDLHYLKDLFKKGFSNKKFKKEYYKWDGFWAICYIKQESIIFFTDPLGKKQLYCNKLGIASEIKPLINADTEIQTIKIDKTPDTNFSNIKRAMPGQFYVYHFEMDQANNYVYGNKNYLGDTMKHSDIYELLDKSIQLRSKTSYGKLGLLYSGGLDSSIVAHHLVKNNIPFTALSINNKETLEAKRIAKQIGFEIKFINDEISDEEVKQAVLAYEGDLDYGSLIPQYLLFKEARRLGLYTILTGDGADELFSGYGRALSSDTQHYDVFTELPFYHHLRIDRLSMMHTVEARNPFLNSNIVNYALNLDYTLRRNKRVLRDTYRQHFDTSMSKKPLRYKQNKNFNLKNTKKIFTQTFNRYLKNKEYE